MGKVLNKGDTDEALILNKRGTVDECKRFSNHVLSASTINNFKRKMVWRQECCCSLKSDIVE